MKREVITNERTGDSYVKIMHDSGLEILIWKTPGFSAKQAMFSTRYGSVNTTFRTNEDADFVTVPEGIAHYLEHKLFENEDSKVFELYAQTGALGNAYTSFDRTCYYFSCTENFMDSLAILLDFVQSPYFTEETVAKEQGIIAQEIKMYDDDPNWAVFFGLLGGIYHKNPVKIDIAGTVESIAKITPDLLYRCYYTFYDLHNMCLSIAGDVDEDEILALCDKMLKVSPDKGLISIVPDEPDTVVTPYSSTTFEIALPMFNLGFKSAPVAKEDMIRTSVLSNLTLGLIGDESSPLYADLYGKGLINQGFGCETFIGSGFYVPLMGGESPDPKRTAEIICKEIERCKREGFDNERFDTIRKAYYGSIIQSFNSPDSIASLLNNTGLQGTGDAFSVMRTVASVTPEDVHDFLCERFDTANSSLFVVDPKQGAQS